VLGLCGTACGAVGAALLTRLLGSLLFGTSPLDPATYALVALGLVGVTALASYVPAHAATSVDSAQTLRGDERGVGQRRCCSGLSATSPVDGSITTILPASPP
jgi:hypothetical protein